MICDIVILECARKHGLTDDDISHAMRNVTVARTRNFDPPAHVLLAGPDLSGNLIEVLYAQGENGAALVYHAMRLTPKAARELGLL